MSDGIDDHLKARRKALGASPGFKCWQTLDDRNIMHPDLPDNHPWAERLRRLRAGETNNADTDNPLGGEAHVHLPECAHGGDGTGIFWALVLTGVLLGAFYLLWRVL